VKWIESWSLPTREGIFCQNLFSSWGLSSFGLNQNFLFVEKKKTQTEVGDLWIHSTANYWEQSCRQVMLLPKFLSRKKLSRKYRSIFASKISPATGVTFRVEVILRCVAVCCSALQRVVVCCGVVVCFLSQRSFTKSKSCCSVLQCVAVCCGVVVCLLSQCWLVKSKLCCSVMQCGCMFIESTLADKVVVVLQCVAVCCSVDVCLLRQYLTKSKLCCSVTRCCCRFVEPALIYKDQIVLQCDAVVSVYHCVLQCVAVWLYVYWVNN